MHEFRDTSDTDRDASVPRPLSDHESFFGAPGHDRKYETRDLKSGADFGVDS